MSERLSFNAMASSKSNTVQGALLGFARATDAAPHFGQESKVEPVAPSADQIEALRQDLRRIITSNEAYFRICVGFLVILFVGACIFVYKSLSDPNHIAAVFAGTGVSVMGAVTQMIRLWKEKVNSDLLLTLAGTLSPSDLKKVVDVLLKSYLKQK
jgi:hypothetical protein